MRQHISIPKSPKKEKPKPGLRSISPNKLDFKEAKKKLAEAEARKISRILKRANHDNTTDWETTMLADVQERLEEHGAAFYDPEKGDPSQPLSVLQNFKIKEIGREIKLRDKIGMKEARRQIFGRMKKQHRRSDIY